MIIKDKKDVLRATLPEGKGEQTYKTPQRGLRLRVTPNQKSWQFVANRNGKHHKHTAARADITEAQGGMTYAEAVKAYHAWSGDIAAHIAEKARQRKAVIDADKTFAQVVDQFLEDPRSTRKQATTENYKRYLHSELVAERLHQMPITHITADDIQFLLDDYEKDGKTASNLLKVLSALFSYCQAMRLRESNPCLKRITKTYSSNPQGFTYKELKQVWDADFNAKFDWNDLIRCYLLTGGLRDTAIREGTWSEVDFEDGFWIIPPTRMKRQGSISIAHHLPLIGPLRDHLLQLREKGPNNTFIFQSERLQDGELVPYPISKVTANTRKIWAERTGFTSINKKIRKTIYTMLIDHGMSSDHVQILQGAIERVREGRGANYDDAKHRQLRTSLLTKWHELLLDIVS